MWVRKPGGASPRWRPSIIIISALAVFSLVPTAVTAQDQKLLKLLQGNWRGDGKAFGMPAQLQLQWDSVLGDKFLRLSLRSEMTTPTGEKQVFEGHAYYHASTEGKYEAQWFDSRGMTFPIKAQVEANSLIAFWGFAALEEGKSTYRLVDSNTMEVVDSVKQKDGMFREFGRAILKRL